jgi:raffinose/stachyose/melibiose transport system substrate-binding protein
VIHEYERRHALRPRLKALPVLGATLAALLVVYAGPGSAGAASKTPSGARGETVTITVWHNHPEWKSDYQKIINLFEKLHPGIKVNLTMIPATQYSAKLQAAIASNTLPDMAHVPPTLIPTLWKQHMIIDLTGKVSMQHVSPSTRPIIYYNGRLLGVPWNGFSTPPMYQVGIFEKYHLAAPTSWSDWLSEMQTLKTNGVAPMMIDGQDMTQPTFLYMALAASIIDKPNVDSLLETGKVKLNQPSMLPALQYIVNMKPYFETGYLGESYTQSKADFALGKTAMIAAGGQGDQAGLVQVNPKINDSAFGIPPQRPGGKSVSIVGNDLPLVINSHSAHVADDLLFAKFLLSKPAQEIVAGNIGQPARTDVNSKTNKVFAAINAAGALKIEGWWELPSLANVFTTFMSDGSGLLTGRYTVQQFANLLQSKIVIAK